MRDFEVILALLFVSTLVQPIARRLDVPLAIAQVVCGLALSAVPVVAQIALDPELTFALFVPPLLFWAASTGRCATSGGTRGRSCSSRLRSSSSPPARSRPWHTPSRPS